MSDVIVYSKPDCGACDLVKTWMDNNGVAYIAVDATEDKAIMDELRDNGYMSFPVIKVGGWGNSWVGFDLNKLEELT